MYNSCYVIALCAHITYTEQFFLFKSDLVNIVFVVLTKEGRKCFI